MSGLGDKTSSIQHCGFYVKQKKTKQNKKKTLWHHATIFDQISWNKIWKLVLCNAEISFIFMHFNSPFGVCKVEAFPNAWSSPPTPVWMSVAPVSKKQNLVFQHCTGGEGAVTTQAPSFCSDNFFIDCRTKF